MTLKPGSYENDDAFADSMAEDIENALKMEWLAIKGEPFPEIGKSARRIFLSAIAQGVINHLMNHDPHTFPIIQSYYIKLDPSGGNVNKTQVSGSIFSPGADVTVIWDDPATIQSISVQTNGPFTLDLNIPDGAKLGRHVIEARDGRGNVALAVFVIA
jgi:hypothetical protein